MMMTMSTTRSNNLLPIAVVFLVRIETILILTFSIVIVYSFTLIDWLICVNKVSIALAVAIPRPTPEAQEDAPLFLSELTADGPVLEGEEPSEVDARHRNVHRHNQGYQQGNYGSNYGSNYGTGYNSAAGYGGNRYNNNYNNNNRQQYGSGSHRYQLGYRQGEKEEGLVARDVDAPLQLAADADDVAPHNQPLKFE